MNVQYGLITTSELLKERDPDSSYTFAGITVRNFNAAKESSGIEGALTEVSNRIHHNLTLTENIIEFLPKIKVTHYRISTSLFSILSDFSNNVTVSINDLPDSSAVDFVKTFFENYKKLDREAQSRIVIQNEDEGFWNPINLFKYFHVYLNEKFKEGMVLSYHNYADQMNPGMLGEDAVEAEINVGAFHETWKGVVPIFLWSEKESGNPKVSAEYLSGPIPDFNYQIKWECDVRKRDKAIARFTMPQDEDKVTEEVIMTITKNKYKRSRDASKAFNALYDAQSS
jgi:UV DNA damage repair endonuclease